jgi:hypothetical protein
MTRRQIRLLRSLGLVVLVFLAEVGWAQERSKAVVVRATKHVVAPPLSQIRPMPPQSERLRWLPDENDAILERGLRAARPVQDSLLQPLSDASALSAFPSLSVNSGLNFLGLGTGFPGFNVSANIPDTNGAVGPTQFVQFVNDSFAVFNKSNGSLAYGPALGNTLWQAMGAPCSPNPNLDEIAQFDKLANRWVMMMPDFNSPTYICVAVSTTSDAVNGGWNLYAFRTPVNNTVCNCRPMTDYPKLAVWPDGYYLTWSEIWNGNYIGAEACAIDRNSMLSGAAAATMQCFSNTGTSYGFMLPADVDGTTPPPSGSPEYFLDFDGNGQSLDLWQFHVNWTAPANTTFTGSKNIPVAAFSEACGETVVEFNYTTGNCIPQAGTSVTLDSYADRLMYRLAYRNFGGHQSLVANHTVTTGTNGSQTGIRWYELRNTGSGFGLYQQGTYAPDSSYRWMGSIAMDNAGDIALGYSVSSATMNPSIAYTGRVPGDTLGQMESEVDVLASKSVPHGSRTNNFRWADYSSLAVDPTDDCTFWYTTEYMPGNGGNWSTRIASFSFPSCTNASTNPSWTVLHKASTAGSTTSLTIPATGTGNLIAVALMFNGNTSVASVSDNAGNTYVSAGARCARNNNSVEIWYAQNSLAGATAITPSFVGSPTSVEITSWEASGVLAVAPDATNTASGNITLNNTPGAAVTTSQTGDFIVSVMIALNASLSAISSGNEFTNDFKTNGNGWAHITSNSSSTGTHQASWYTANPSGAYCASTVAFAP